MPPLVLQPLVENAVRHGRAGGRIALALTPTDITVTDDGPGIPAQDWQQVIRRFVSSKSGEGSSGLGFAIASEVATTLKGALAFREPTPESGFTVFLELPLLDKRSAT